MPPYILCPRCPLASSKFPPYLEQRFQPPSWFCGLKGLSWAALLDSPRGSGARGVAADWQLGRKPPGGSAKMLLQLWTCTWHRPPSLQKDSQAREAVRRPDSKCSQSVEGDVASPFEAEPGTATASLV